MIKQKGWGEKTAALFCKSIFHLHNGNYSKEIKIWDDVPSIIARKDIFYLPVDAVIIAIFNKLEPLVKWNFTNINKYLRYHYNSSDIEIWDDLWFWGFITQNGSQNRIFEWNENKYWVLKESDKSQIIIDEIKTKSNEFLSLIN
ncbi:hypothetical protein B0A80_16910 [Flavobacterium tructae]|nr:hypothetical protein B0A80_16910 [Flavobacterium tructae]